MEPKSDNSLGSVYLWHWHSAAGGAAMQLALQLKNRSSQEYIIKLRIYGKIEALYTFIYSQIYEDMSVSDFLSFVYHFLIGADPPYYHFSEGKT